MLQFSFALCVRSVLPGNQSHCCYHCGISLSNNLLGYFGLCPLCSRRRGSWVLCDLSTAITPPVCAARKWSHDVRRLKTSVRIFSLSLQICRDFCSPTRNFCFYISLPLPSELADKTRRGLRWKCRKEVPPSSSSSSCHVKNKNKNTVKKKKKVP